VRRRLGWWLLVAVLATGCTTSDANPRQGSDPTDVWFVQHMVPHLLQSSATVQLSQDRITHPELTRLAGTIGATFCRSDLVSGDTPTVAALRRCGAGSNWPRF
jgi:hypothetical protein